MCFVEFKIVMQTPDRRQKRLTGLLPVQRGLVDKVHLVLRIPDSTVPCGYTVDGPSETKQIAGVVWPFEVHLYQLRSAPVFLLSTHPEVRLPGLTISHVRL